MIIQGIFKNKEKGISKKRSVSVFPLMNPIGFETQSRKISFTEEDLNRSFPGNVKGSHVERLIHGPFFSGVKRLSKIIT